MNTPLVQSPKDHKRVNHPALEALKMGSDPFNLLFKCTSLVEKIIKSKDVSLGEEILSLLDEKGADIVVRNFSKALEKDFIAFLEEARNKGSDVATKLLIKWHVLLPNHDEIIADVCLKALQKGVYNNIGLQVDTIINFCKIATYNQDPILFDALLSTLVDLIPSNETPLLGLPASTQSALLDFLTKAHQQGAQLAVVGIALCKYIGCGCEPLKLETVVEYLDQNGNKACPEVHFYLGILKGLYQCRITPDIIEGLSTNPLMEAQCLLGQYYLFGGYFKVDDEIHTEYYSKILHVYACSLQGILITEKVTISESIKPFILLGIGLISKAAFRGERTSKCILGLCYSSGIGVMQDPVKAFSLFEESAALGSPFAESHVAYCLLEGLGTQQDRERGEKLQKSSLARIEDLKKNKYFKFY